MPTLSHTKIYGNGVSDVLAQAEIKGSYVDGILKIELSPDRCLTVVATDDKILHFFIETSKDPRKFSY